MIEVTKIKKSFGSIQAVVDISFAIDTGEVVGLLGPNGAGKTTTLNMITGVYHPDEGKILIDGMDITKEPLAIKDQIGYLPEDNPLYDNLLVCESLKIVSQIKGLTQTQYEDALERIVTVSGIKDIFYRPIGTLSKGLRQRTGLAHALIGNPKVLILDEPTEGLDPNQRQEIRKLITDLSRDHTILMSTHVMQEVEAICQRVIILNQGEVVVSGSVAEISQSAEGKIEVEISLGGNSSQVINQITQKFPGTKVNGSELILSISSAIEEEVYQTVSNLIGNGIYIKKLNKKKVNLEEVFSRLTKKD